jgi:hypothetical protein
VVESVEDEGDIEKAGSEATGTNTADVSTMLIVNSVECKIPSPVSMIKSV